MRIHDGTVSEWDRTTITRLVKSRGPARFTFSARFVEETYFVRTTHEIALHTKEVIVDAAVSGSNLALLTSDGYVLRVVSWGLESRIWVGPAVCVDVDANQWFVLRRDGRVVFGAFY